MEVCALSGDSDMAEGVDSAPADWQELARDWKKARCPSCGKRGQYYCTACPSPIRPPAGVLLPEVQLPCAFDVVLADYSRQNTGAQAPILAPRHARLLMLGQDAAPDYDPKTTFLAFPGEASRTVYEVEDPCQIERIVMVDTPWALTHKVIKQAPWADLPTLRLADPPDASRYWRWHYGGPGCLCTIEALALFAAEVAEAQDLRRRGAAGPRTAGDTLRHIAPAPRLAPRAEEAKDEDEAVSVGPEHRAASTEPRDMLFLFNLQFAKVAYAHAQGPHRDKPPPFSRDAKARRMRRVNPGFRSYKLIAGDRGIPGAAEPAAAAAGEGGSAGGTDSACTDEG